MKKPRFSRFDWEEMQDQTPLEVSGVDQIRELLLIMRAMPDPSLEVFFSLALAPFFDEVLHNGMTTEAGNVLYRLSDLVHEQQRRFIKVYPKAVEFGMGWHTLQEWREVWVLQFKAGEADIPFVNGTPPDMPAT